MRVLLKDRDAWLLGFTIGCFCCDLQQTSATIATDAIIVTDAAIATDATIVTVGHMLNVKLGDRLELPCEVENIDYAVVVWRKGKRMLTNGRHIFGLAGRQGHLKLEVSEGNYTLVIREARPDDKGEYICWLEKEDTGYPVNITHNVTVTDPPTADMQAPEISIEIPHGDSFSVSCITTGEPEPTVTWQLKDERGNTRQLPHFAGMRNITVEHLNRADAGTYYCVADNGVGEAVSSHVTIVVT